ncbi:hypothetical protein GCM10011365_05500 [Marinicella pacifica]|uniref:Sulfotransferase domain-containing protein n=1 Tax=Marinicella pacifica TaxID=1171543 RepID=A0A917CFW4_9GAMM|nr:hypothetical protein GCM10011365_05500 [Marinicella pacifica]
MKELKEQSDNAVQLSDNLALKISNLRSKIKNKQPIEIVFKKNSSELPDNYFKRINKKTQKNQREIRAVKLPQSSANNLFIIKANALFTANLGGLLNGNWPIIAVIRDPVSVIMSWRSVKIASSKGRLPNLEKYSIDLADIGKQKPLLKRQVLLIDWYFKQFSKKSKVSIIRYEDLVENPKKIVFDSTGLEISGNYSLNSKNNRPEYNHKEKIQITEYLHKYGKHYLSYYNY